MRYYLILLFALSYCNQSFGQYHFVNFNFTNGLNIDEITSIKQDTKGYLWLGSPNGLVRYDGENFKRFYPGTSKDHVAGSFVSDVDVAPDGKVVISFVDNGISIYDPLINEFISTQYNPTTESNFPEGNINFLHVLSDSIAYFGVRSGGLYSLDLNELKVEPIDQTIKASDLISMHQDDGLSYYLNNGLYQYNLKDAIGQKLSDGGFSGIKIVGNELWYHSYVGEILRYDLSTQKLTTYKTACDCRVRSFTLKNNKIWVGTTLGLEIIDQKTSAIDTILKAGPEPDQLKGSLIHEVYEDDEGRIWVATDGGLSMYNPKDIYFEPTEKFKNQTSDFTQLPNGEILSIDFNKNTVRLLSEQGKEQTLKVGGALEKPVKFLSKDEDQYIIFFNGIGKYHPISKRVEAFSCPFTKSKARGLIDIQFINQDWVGLYRYRQEGWIWDEPSNKVDTIKLGTEPRGTFLSGDGNLWIYGNKLLKSLSIGNKTLGPNQMVDTLSTHLLNDIISIDQSKNKLFIASRYNGVWGASYVNGKFNVETHYTEDKGLLDYNPQETYIDEYGNYIVKASGGIYIYDAHLDRFHQLGGHGDLKMTLVYGIKALDSIVYALGYQSKSVDLKTFNATPKKSMFSIEAIVVNGTNKKIIPSKTLNLLPKENNVSFYFSNILYGAKTNLGLRYRLNENEVWQSMDPHTDRLHLSSLSSGLYNLVIEASDSFGNWEKVYQQSILIQLPTWKKPWFILTLIFMLGLLSYLIYQWRLKQIKKISQVELKLLEMESESLRAQMNPHFIFNALNSIKAYVIKNEKEHAADYLTTFSELIRAVLNNSKQKEISLHDELEALTLYLEIEQMRLNHKFNFDIKVEDVDPKTIAFPPLIIQPFVENSIWHGFVNKKGIGNLLIHVHQREDDLTIEIIDDGIGRKASKKIEQNRGRDRSFGIAITRDRLQNIASKADIRIDDLYDESGKSLGTKVTLSMPQVKITQSN